MESQRIMFSDLYEPPNLSPILCVLNYSGGMQSHCIARKLLRGEIEMPERMLVVAADPGNEHVDTYRIRDRTLQQFRDQGIHAVVAPGPKMLEDLRERKSLGKNRIDTAAQWTENGGRLMQACTREYKIRPMNRVVYAYCIHHLGLRRVPDNSVESWIGFCWDERLRCKPAQDRRQQFRYPLIDLRMTKSNVEQWYSDTGEETPPRSVCNHCWANGVSTFKRICETDPVGWLKAKEFDRLSRDMKQFGVREKCYCSKTLLSLEELELRKFDLIGMDSEALSCDSGYCFV